MIHVTQGKGFCETRSMVVSNLLTTLETHVFGEGLLECWSRTMLKKHRKPETQNPRNRNKTLPHAALNPGPSRFRCSQHQLIQGPLGEAKVCWLSVCVSTNRACEVPDAQNSVPPWCWQCSSSKKSQTASNTSLSNKLAQSRVCPFGGSWHWVLRQPTPAWTPPE